MASHLVVEWTRSTVRLAVGAGPARGLQTLRSGPISTSETVEALRAQLKTMKTIPGDVIAVIPREAVLTRVVKFPSVHEAELAQMVELYAKAQLPYPREQTVMDFHVLARAEGFSTVAVIACQREVVDRHVAILQEAGLSPTLLTVSSWGVLGWYQQGLRRGIEAQEPVLVVNVDDTRTDLVLIDKSRILSSRSVGQGLQEWEASGEAATLLSFEVERSRAAIRNELPGTEVRSLLVTGLRVSGPWDEQLTQRIGLPVTVVDAVRPFPTVSGAAGAGLSPVVAGGLACSHPSTLLNLSPPEIRTQVHHRRRVSELTVVSLLLSAVLAVGAGLLSLQMARQRRVSSTIDRLLADIEPRTKQIKERVQAIQLVSSVLDDRRQLAATLSSVFRTTPASVALEAVTFERPKQEFVLRGSAATNQAVLEYLKQLERVEGVTDVRLKYSTRRTTSTGERTDFEVLLRQRHQDS
ncbi:MAG: pilus assembly protein PilM [Candidatus Omnitrophica bacterium]|nr:pilus assembly protein PilM [Candidatus Omnitrophota bacterium]